VKLGVVLPTYLFEANSGEQAAQLRRFAARTVFGVGAGRRLRWGARHAVERGSCEDVIAKKEERALRRLISDDCPGDYAEAVLLTGSVDEIQQAVEERLPVRVEHLVLHTLTRDVEQLELFARHILAPFERRKP
jgi:hypothetical protein